ncbi:MAG: von Willebrand factor type A domain-containing protein [Planctomycetota bacterium]|nr:von Willebrand factor type A domain-containing protein [Planctomycetota bacterium]
MTEHDQDTPRGPETRLTDYLFGALNAEEMRALEAELATDAQLREQLAELRRTFALLKADAPAVSEGLAPERRAALLSEASAQPAPRGRVLAFPTWMRAAAALVIVAGIVVIWKNASQSNPETSSLSPLGYTAEGSSIQPELARRDREALTSEPAPGEPIMLGGTYRGPSDSLSPAPMEEARARAESGSEFDRAKKLPEALERGRNASLGYSGEDFDLEVEDADASLGFGFDDGYGRRYHGDEVIVHLRRHGNESPRDMFYRYYGDNAVVRTAEDPLSTFATDVDTASWALLRNYLVQGHLPPKAAVRTEECVNAFKHELPAPGFIEDPEDTFAIHLEAAPTPFAPDGHLLLRVGLKAREVTRAQRKPLNLVFVVDKSGSMAQQNRMELVKNSLELLVDQIRDDDTIGLVTFDSTGHEVLAPTPGSERWKIREALRGLSTGGSTNAAEGLFLGYAMAERAFRKDAVNRVVLASDGVANTGETDQAKILEKVRKSSENAVDLTTIGVGMGNHNDVFLERLADNGDGSCHYVDSMDEAKRVFVERFTGTMQVVAREARVQVEFSSGTVREWRQLGYENRVMKHEDFRNDSVDAGEIGAGHEMVALYELRLQDLIDGPDTVATIRLRWKPDGAKEFVEVERHFGIGDARSRWDLSSPRFRLAGTVAQFAEFMRRSVHARGDSYEDLQVRAQALARELKGDPMVVEFRDLVDRTAQLAQRLWPEDELALLIEEARRLRLTECELESLSERSVKAEELLQEVRLQNAALERRLEDLLQPR